MAPRRTPHHRSRPRRSLTFATLTAVAALALAACGSSSDGSSSPYGGSTQGSRETSAPSLYGSATKPDSTRVTLAPHRGKLGTFLVDGEGRPLYRFEKDTSPVSTCENTCAVAWPPFITEGAPKAASGVTEALVGTTRRADGSTQVTYAGHPLYHYAGDQQPGEPRGQGSKASWYVVRPSGEKLDED